MTKKFFYMIDFLLLFEILLLNILKFVKIPGSLFKILGFLRFPGKVAYLSIQKTIYFSDHYIISYIWLI